MSQQQQQDEERRRQEEEALAESLRIAAYADYHIKRDKEQPKWLRDTNTGARDYDVRFMP